MPFTAKITKLIMLMVVNDWFYCSSNRLPSNIVLIVTDCLAISTSTSNISPSELCNFIFGICNGQTVFQCIITQNTMYMVHFTAFLCGLFTLTLKPSMFIETFVVIGML